MKRVSAGRRVLLFALMSAVLLSMVWAFKIPISFAGDGNGGKLLIVHNWASGQTPPSSGEICLTLYKAGGLTPVPASDALVKDDIVLTAPDWREAVNVDDMNGHYYCVVKSPLTSYTTSQTTDFATNTDGLVWEKPNSENPLGSACYFSVLTFGDVSVTSADVESGMAVGGNFSSTAGTYSLGLPGTSNPHADWHLGSNYTSQVGNPIAPHNPRFLVKGNVNATGTLRAYGGSIAVSPDSSVTISKIANFPDDFGAYKCIGNIPGFLYDSSASPDNFTWARAYDAANGADHYASIREDSAKIDQFFVDAKRSLEGLSQHYASLLSTSAGWEIKTDELLGNVYVSPKLELPHAWGQQRLVPGASSLLNTWNVNPIIPDGIDIDAIVFNVEAGYIDSSAGGYIADYAVDGLLLLRY